MDIIATGKHFMKGAVVKTSLVHLPLRPLPLPPGTVSGLKPKTQEEATINSVQEDAKKSQRLHVDVSMILFAVSVMLLAFVFRYLAIL